MKRSGMRGFVAPTIPDYASLLPGYLADAQHGIVYPFAKYAVFICPYAANKHEPQQQELRTEMAPTPREKPLDSNLARTLAQKLHANELVLFAGAGLSHLALPKDGSERRIPLWAGLTGAVANQFGIDPANFGGSPLDLFDAVIYAHSRSDLEKAVTTALDDREFELSPAHRALSELPWYKVVTTNYDALLSRLLDEPFPIVDEPGYDRLQESQVIQIHGKLPQPHTLTRDDYRRWADHDKNPRAAQALSNFALNHTLLFVGYSLNDPHIDELLALARKWTEGREKRIYGLFWKMPDAKRELLNHRDKITAVSIDTPEEWENAFRQIKAEYDNLSAKSNPSPVEVRDNPPFPLKSQPVINAESLNRQIGTGSKTSSSVTGRQAILPDDSCFSNFAPQPHLTAIPGQYFNDINHVVEMIRQKHDVACAEYRLECP